MADKAITELGEARQVNPSDRFVLSQNGEAKQLTGQTLENWLVSFADGHGGIHSIEKTGSIGNVDTYTIHLAEDMENPYTFTVTNGRGIENVTKSTSGLTDSYRIEYNDGTSYTFTVKNAKSISSIAKAGTSGLKDTYNITYNDGTKTTFTVTNGAKGDKGDNAYVHIKYASAEPTDQRPSIGDVPDNWIGICTDHNETAPTDWKAYSWYRIRGDKGNKGDNSTVSGYTTEYQTSTSGVTIPSGTWSTSVPVVPQGRYLWTRTTIRFNTGEPIVSYGVSRNGMDGKGSVSTVNSKNPDADGNVLLNAQDVGARASDWMPTAQDVGARASDWMPTAHDVGARPNTWMPTASQIGATSKNTATVTLTQGGWSNNTQTVNASGVLTSSDIVVSPQESSFQAYCDAVVRCVGSGSGSLTFACNEVPGTSIAVNVLILN